TWSTPSRTSRGASSSSWPTGAADERPCRRLLGVLCDHLRVPPRARRGPPGVRRLPLARHGAARRRPSHGRGRAPRPAWVRAVRRGGAGGRDGDELHMAGRRAVAAPAAPGGPAARLPEGYSLCLCAGFQGRYRDEASELTVRRRKLYQQLHPLELREEKHLTEEAYGRPLERSLARSRFPLWWVVPFVVGAVWFSVVFWLVLSQQVNGLVNLVPQDCRCSPIC